MMNALPFDLSAHVLGIVLNRQSSYDPLMMTSSATIQREVGILERAIGPRGGGWPPEIAKAILTIKLAPETLLA
jgi:hypothetical protein